MERHASQLTAIEQQLADPDLYQAENKAKLSPLLLQQGELKSTMEDLEMQWLDLQEQIEQQEADFSQVSGT